MGLKIKKGKLTYSSNIKNVKPLVKNTNFAAKNRKVVKSLVKKKLM